MRTFRFSSTPLLGRLLTCAALLLLSVAGAWAQTSELGVSFSPATLSGHAGDILSYNVTLTNNTTQAIRITDFQVIASNTVTNDALQSGAITPLFNGFIYPGEIDLAGGQSLDFADILDLFLDSSLLPGSYTMEADFLGTSDSNGNVRVLGSQNITAEVPGNSPLVPEGRSLPLLSVALLTGGVSVWRQKRRERTAGTAA